jgi:hypothetical protein
VRDHFGDEFKKHPRNWPLRIEEKMKIGITG